MNLVELILNNKFIYSLILTHALLIETPHSIIAVKTYE